MNAPQKHLPEPTREDLLALLAERDHELAAARERLTAISTENARLADETRDAAERQTATSEILKIVASSRSDLRPAFDAIAASAKRLLRGHAATVTRWIDGKVHLAAFTPTNPDADAAMGAAFPRPLANNPAFEAQKDGRVFQVADIETNDPFGFRDIARRRGWRSLVTVPLSSRGTNVGSIAVTRSESGAFGEDDVQLLRTFADQAVIAIENARLFEEVQAKTRDLSEALVYQTASAKILEVIASSPTDVAPVLQAIVDSACEVCEAYDAAVNLREGDFVRFSAHRGPIPLGIEGRPLSRGWVGGRAILDRAPVHVGDLQLAGDEFPEGGEMALRMGHRAILAVPLLREGESVGAIVVRRNEAQPFTNKQIEVLRSFADQAVIAIGNARLFEEVRARTHDLSEALQQQTATADVLKVISRSVFDLETVLETLIDTAVRLARGSRGTIFLRQGDVLVARAFHRNVPDAIRAYLTTTTWRLDGDSQMAQAFREGKVVHIPDLSISRLPSDEATRARAAFGAGLWAPLMREGQAIGVFGVPRDEPIAFSDREIELVQTFADQAVIAIENTRLFEEVQARTRDLAEALQQQTATADVLKAISRSVFDLDTVLETLITTAQRLCNANKGEIFRRHGDVYRYGASNYDVDPRYLEHERNVEIRPGRGTLVGRVAQEKRAILIDDAWSDPEYEEKEQARIGVVRAMLGVPLMRGGEPIGAFALARGEPTPFTQRQVELVTTFADQAVIAIENVRLFDALQAKTRDLSEALQQQTATADVLKVISRSAFDLQAVFDTLTASAVELCGAFSGTICVREGDVHRYRGNAGPGFSPAMSQYLTEHPAAPGRGTIAGRVLMSGKVEAIPDVFRDTEYAVPMSAHGVPARSLLGVPLLAKGGIEGALVLTRLETGPFTDRQIEIGQTFADQAVIAIENSRLFEQVQARTRELTASLDDLRKAQDRLVQSEKLASLGQLTAGIAHEIKNPLNFVNNFASLSRELLAEMRDLLAPAALDADARADVDELMGMLDSNLDKVAHHGKRADSIVKNMLLHSREGSGERIRVSINAMVEEALNLGYHGARAEKPGFNVTIEKSLDPRAGEADLYLQEITRVLLNLIANGFYATAKREQTEAASYQPTLSASTRSLGDRVEIRVRDNGTGIPEQVRAKMFNPFFTTKPAGEGTGLGLSLSHDIVVKQHGGSIEVATELGAFTEFIITLPRVGAKA